MTEGQNDDLQFLYDTKGFLSDINRLIFVQNIHGLFFTLQVFNRILCRITTAGAKAD